MRRSKNIEKVLRHKQFKLTKTAPWWDMAGVQARVLSQTIKICFWVGCSDSCPESQHFGKLRWADHLRSRV